MSKRSQIQTVLDSINAKIATLQDAKAEVLAVLDAAKPRKPRVVKPAAVKQGA